MRAQVARLERLLARNGRADLAGRSAAEVLAPLGVDPGARQAIESRLQVSWGRPVGGPDRWVERLRALRPELAVEAGEVVLATWSDDPWSRGAYSTRGLGWEPKDAELLARPVGRLRFAREHTAGRWSGSIEGALRSGLRAADDILRWSAGELAAQDGC
jgi:hypothetical protein